MVSKEGNIVDRIKPGRLQWAGHICLFFPKFLWRSVLIIYLNIVARHKRCFYTSYKDVSVHLTTSFQNAVMASSLQKVKPVNRTHIVVWNTFVALPPPLYKGPRNWGFAIKANSAYSTTNLISFNPFRFILSTKLTNPPRLQKSASQPAQGPRGKTFIHSWKQFPVLKTKCEMCAFFVLSWEEKRRGK